MAGSVTAELRAAPPGLHGAGDEYWGLAWAALEWLERNVEPGMATVETGAGSSTIVFAARGASHVAVTPDPAEEERIRAACRALGVDDSGVRFAIGASHEVLPAWDGDPLDLALVDGAHGFPYPILDWWYLAPHLRIGGRLVIDDAYMPAVGAVVDALRADPAWAVDEAVGHRTVVVRKVAAGLPRFDWHGERIGGRMSFRYLPPRRRVAAAIQHRVFTTELGLRAVALARRRSRLRWRKTG
ncbi:MAG: class I SAM-dependent methyltransferase [Actinomycetota bacterium]|nr:class I SAM-dependent methyltransferase [Actinomycetota bacterium]